MDGILTLPSQFRIGDNNLDTEAVHVLAEILQSTRKLLILG